MARSIYCSTCKKEKEPGRDNESRCKACKSQANKDKRAKQREEKGLPAFGSGRSIYCYDCKAAKEKQEYGYCNACRRKKDNENRLASGRTKKHQTGKCPCGAERASYSPSYCIDCLTARSKERRQLIPLTREQKDWINERRRNKVGEAKFKDSVRAITGRKIKQGVLIKQPCEVCGTNEDIQAHHDDYYKPLDVRWLCRKHHQEHHKTND